MANLMSNNANAAMYDQTMQSGNKPSFVANIKELMAGYKGSTKGGTARKPTYATKQATKVAKTSKVVRPK